MEYTVTVDRQGRLVLPSSVRKALGLKDGGRLSVRLDGMRAILEPKPEGVEERLQAWVNLALSTKAEAFTEKLDESWKWMSREYARRKLGLR